MHNQAAEAGSGGCGIKGLEDNMKGLGKWLGSKNPCCPKHEDLLRTYSTHVQKSGVAVCTPKTPLLLA